MADPTGTITIDVEPNLSSFRTSLARQLRELADEIEGGDL